MPKSILLIDDDPLITKSLNRFLKSHGFNVEIVQSGMEAVQRTKEEHFDLIISDIRMPGMDGIETLKRIRESSEQRKKNLVPAVIITGYSGVDDLNRKAEELGIAGCIYKPFELDEFISIINKSLEPSSASKVEDKEIISGAQQIGYEFASLINDIEAFLKETKEDLDKFDRLNGDELTRIDFIRGKKKEIFITLDNYFIKVWDLVKDYDKDKYIIYQNYSLQRLECLLGSQIEINRHIHQKPFGYPGDYLMMNYIYDYNGDNNYLGKSSFEKIVNNYTCNIPISSSNIKRKEFLKRAIIETLEKKENVNILSVACGPARELIEVIREGGINKAASFICLDFEKKALDYLKNEVEKNGLAKRQLLSVEYIHRDITSIIRDKELKNKLKGKDLIYAFGIFDYLGDRMAARLAKELYQLLANGGELIICNASSENSSHRAYYEFLGGWNMVYRTKEEMISWAKGIDDIAEKRFDALSDHTSYLFFSLIKPSSSKSL